jgi:hypothetical protein
VNLSVAVYVPSILILAAWTVTLVACIGYRARVRTGASLGLCVGAAGELVVGAASLALNAARNWQLVNLQGAAPGWILRNYGSIAGSLLVAQVVVAFTFAGSLYLVLGAARDPDRRLATPA